MTNQALDVANAIIAQAKQVLADNIPLNRRSNHANRQD